MSKSQVPTEETALLGPHDASSHNDGDITSPTSIDTEIAQSKASPPTQPSTLTNNNSDDLNPELYAQLKRFAPACAIGVYLAAADQTIVVSSYGTIGSDLSALNLTSWIATGYLLSLTSFQPLYGKLSDIFGRKTCLLFAYTIFGLGGLCCGLAPNVYALIAARVFQGIGGGGMTVVVSIVLNDVLPLKERGVWQGWANLVYAVGSASGAPLGGLCSDLLGWRWMFLLQAPLSALAIVAVSVMMRLPAGVMTGEGREGQEKGWWAKLKRIDFVGAAVLVLAVLGLLVGMDRGSNVSWKAPVSYGPLIAAAVLLVVFVYVELRVAAEPFAPVGMISNRNMIVVYMALFFSLAGWISVLFYVPLYFQAVEGTSATIAGTRLLPVSASLVLGSLGAGYVIKSTGRYYWLAVSAYVLMATGVAFIFLFSGIIVRSLAGILVGAVLAGMGSGMGNTATLIALVADTSRAEQAVAIACSYLFRGLGSTVGLSVSATVIQSVLRSTLERELGNGKEAEEIEDKVRQSLDVLKQLSPKKQKIVRDAYAVAIQHSYVVCLAFCVVAIAFAFLIREKKTGK